MKIVIASGIYPPDIGGPATYSRLIAEEFTKRNIEVSVICYSDKSGSNLEELQTPNPKQFKVIRISRKKNVFFRYLSYFFNLLKLIRNADIVYAQGPLAAGLPTLMASKILRKKFIIKIVGDYAWEQCQNNAKRKNQNAELDDIETFQNKKYDSGTELRRKIQKIVVKNANKIITPSEFLKKIVIGWGIKENKIKVIYNAAPEVGEILAINHKTGLEGDILISAARLEPWKGMVALVEIMPELLQKNPNFKLLIAGDGPLAENLKLRIKELNLSGRVVLLGRIPHNELMSYFKASKIFILNTGYEGFPHIILEAMACRLPIITTNVCGNPELIKDNYNGFLVDYNNKEQIKNAILKIWENKNLSKEFVENGINVLKDFSKEKMIDKTLEVLSLEVGASKSRTSNPELRTSNQ